MPESSPKATQVNPYQPPQLPTIENRVVTSLRGRICFAVIASISVLLFAILYHTTVSVSVTFTAVFSAAVVLGFMPRGYGKYDWTFGLWIILLGVTFGLTAWWRKLATIHPMDRGHSLLIHLAFLGLAPGIAASLPYVAARAFAKRGFEVDSFRKILISEELVTDPQPDSVLSRADSGVETKAGITIKALTSRVRTESGE